MRHCCHNGNVASSGLLPTQQQTAQRWEAIITNMATRIGRGRRPHLYIEEHMTAKDASNASIAKRLEIHRSTVGKWLAKGQAISIDELRQLAHALDLDDWTDFLRPPGRESLDTLIEGIPDNMREAIVDFAKKVRTGQG